MKDIGYGAEYRYAHDEPDAYAAGECYLPQEIAERQYYHPQPRGREIRIGDKLERLKELYRSSDKQRYKE